MRQAHSELQRWCSLLGLGDLTGQPGMAASVADADMARSACLAAMHSARGTGTSSNGILCYPQPAIWCLCPALLYPHVVE